MGVFITVYQRTAVVNALVTVAVSKWGVGSDIAAVGRSG